MTSFKNRPCVQVSRFILKINDSYSKWNGWVLVMVEQDLSIRNKLPLLLSLKKLDRQWWKYRQAWETSERFLQAKSEKKAMNKKGSRWTRKKKVPARSRWRRRCYIMNKHWSVEFDSWLHSSSRLVRGNLLAIVRSTPIRSKETKGRKTRRLKFKEPLSIFFLLIAGIGFGVWTQSSFLSTRI